MTPDMRIRVFDTYKKLCRLGLRSVIEESRANAHSSLALTSASGFSLAADQSVCTFIVCCGYLLQDVVH